jgi:hypothetical protein
MCNVCDENGGCSMLGEYRFKYLRLVAQNNDGFEDYIRYRKDDLERGILCDKII